MKIQCDKSSLVNVMKIILRAIPKKTTNPILECVLIEADNSGIRMTSNDLEMCINTMMDGTVIEPGSVAIDANMLNNIAMKLPNASIKIETDIDATSVKISAGKSKFNIPCKSADDFIGMPPYQEGTSITVPQDDLRDLILSVAFCSNPNDNNAMITGCNLEIDGNMLSLCGLDGHRIGYKKITLNEYHEKESVVIPTKTLMEISKIFAGDEPVNVVISPAHVVFSFGRTVILSRLIAGDFFKYEKIFTQEPSTTVHLYGTEFSDCVNRSTVLIRESDKKPLILEITDNNIHFVTQSTMGQATEDLEIEKTGDDLRVGYNPRFLLDAINAIDHDDIEIRMCGARGPAMLTEDGCAYMYVVLPVNIA